MTVFGIQDQEVIIKPYFKCMKVLFEDGLLLDQMFSHKKTEYCRQHNCKMLNF